jgi:hypothetical protein
MNKSTLIVGDNAPQFEWLNQNSNAEVLVLFMGKVARPNANGKSKSLVQAITQNTIKDIKICLVWDNNEEEVQAFKATVPGLVGLNNVYDVYDLDQSIQSNYKSVLYKGTTNPEDESAATGTGDDIKLGFPDYLIKDGKIVWAQENKKFYELSLLLRGWRP